MNEFKQIASMTAAALFVVGVLGACLTYGGDPFIYCSFLLLVLFSGGVFFLVQLVTERPNEYLND